MPIIDTSLLRPDEGNLQIYGALDAAVTLEVHEALTRLRNEPSVVYNFELGLQGPVLDMALRGFAVDPWARQRGMAALESQLRATDSVLQELAIAFWGKTLNARSSAQLKDFFYSKMNLPEQKAIIQGKWKVSCNRECLEKLEVFIHARPFVSLILDYRDTAKRLEVLRTEVDPDGRMRTAYNIAGTKTGRWSSSASALGTGGNLQNITPDLRGVFVSDPAFRLVGIDLEQAESREVGWQCGVIFGDWTYLDACEGGDLHTTVCKLTWPDLQWSGVPQHDRRIAETPFYRHLTYRDMAKKLGHGCVTEDHEVLTTNGWVSISTKPSQILAWSPLGSKWETPLHWTDRLWSGEMTELEGNSISGLLTGDHKVVFKRDSEGPYHECAATNFPKVGLIPLGGNYLGGTDWSSDKAITPAEARLLAAFQADGSRGSGKTIRFHLRKTRKVERLRWLAAECGLTIRETGHEKYDLANDWMLKKAGPYLLDMSREALVAYTDEHKYWDGYIGKTQISVSAKNREHLEWIQTIGRLVGVGGNISKPYQSGFGTTMYRLQQNRRQFADISSLSVKRSNVEGVRVYCPTVPSGAFWIRRNGKIWISGNSNYGGQPYTLARHAKIPEALAKDFQGRYFAAFPAIQRWHKWVAQELQTSGVLTTPFGRQRRFFGRPNDPATLREAIAYVPQSSTGDRMNLGLWRIWKHMPEVQLLAQVHDAVYFQVPEGLNLKEVIKKALCHIDIPIQGPSRSYSVPGEVKVGWNWGKWSESNPNGLKKWTGDDSRVRLAPLSPADQTF